MTMRNGPARAAMLALAAMLAGLLAGCDSKPAASGGVVQGKAPEGTISDELPDLSLLPNDAPLADPADQGLVPPAPGVAQPVPVTDAPGEAVKAAPVPAAPAESAKDDAIAE